MATQSSFKSNYQLFCVNNEHMLYSWKWLPKSSLDQNSIDRSTVIVNGFTEASYASLKFEEVRAIVTDQYNCTQLIQACQETHGSDYKYIYSTPTYSWINNWQGVVDLDGDKCPHLVRQLTKFDTDDYFGL